ncbi:hypothetical protein BASA60_006297 [Batrachochytrium salamandrivorans]|nr:hypothetical protein BASA60_006297 [Batrachochytrium salamandrivorans]KAH6577807.1 hypothetical protein BASA62_000677 [Batrachochytrium salamandrivorans]
MECCSPLPVVLSEMSLETLAISETSIKDKETHHKAHSPLLDVESTLLDHPSSTGSSDYCPPQDSTVTQSVPTVSAEEPVCGPNGEWCADQSILKELLESYTHIRANIYRGRTNGKVISEFIKCDCDYNPSRDPSWMACGEESDCINRQLSLECSVEDCSTGSACKNRRFQLCEYAPIQVARAGLKGFGVFAMEDIPMGTFIIEYCGEVISASLFHKRTVEHSESKARHFYFMSLKKNEFIDASKKGNCSRFLNHSCDPNCTLQKWLVGDTLRIGLFALRTIPKGTEVTFDYKFERYGSKAQDCHCGASVCTGSIGGSRSASKQLLSSDSNQSESEDDDEDDDESGSDDDKSSRSSSIGLGRSSVKKSQSSSRKLARKSLKAARRIESVESLKKAVRALFFAGSHLDPALRILQRLRSIEDHVLYRKFLGLHGLDVMRNCVFSTKYHFEVVKLVVDILHKLPITSRNPVILLMKFLEEMTQKQTMQEATLESVQLLLKRWGTLAIKYVIPKRTASSISDAHRDGSIVSGSLPSMPIAGSNGSGLIPTSDAFLSPVTALSVAAATDPPDSLSTPPLSVDNLYVEPTYFPRYNRSSQSHRVSARSLNDTLTSSYSAAVVAAGPAGCTSTNGIARSSSHLPTTASAQGCITPDTASVLARRSLPAVHRGRDLGANIPSHSAPPPLTSALSLSKMGGAMDNKMSAPSIERGSISTVSVEPSRSSAAPSSTSKNNHSSLGALSGVPTDGSGSWRDRDRNTGQRHDPSQRGDASQSQNHSMRSDRPLRHRSRDRSVSPSCRRYRDLNTNSSRAQSRSLSRERHRDEGRRDSRIHCNISRDRSKSRDRGRRQDSRDRSRSGDRGRRQDSRDRSRSRDRGRRQDSRDRSRSRDRGRRQDSRDRSRSRDRGRRQDSRDRSKSRDRGRRQDSRDRSRSRDRGRRQDSRDRSRSRDRGRRQDSRDRSRSRDRGRRQDSRDRSRSRDRGRRQDSRDRSRSRGGKYESTRNSSRCSSRDSNRRRSRQCDTQRDRSRSAVRHVNQTDRYEGRYRADQHRSSIASSSGYHDKAGPSSNQLNSSHERSRRSSNSTHNQNWGRTRSQSRSCSRTGSKINVDEHLEIPRALGSDKNGDDCSSESQDIKHVKDIHHSDRDVEIRRDTNLPYVNCTDAVHSRMTASGLCSPQSRSVKSESPINANYRSHLGAAGDGESISLPEIQEYVLHPSGVSTPQSLSQPSLKPHGSGDDRLLVDTLVEVWMPDSGVATTSDLTLDNNLSSGVSTLKRKSDITMSDMAIGHHVKRFPKPHSKSSNISHPRSYGQIDIKANKPHASEMIDSKQGQTYMSERQGLHSARGATSSTLVSNDDIKLAKKELHGIAIKQLSKFADMFLGDRFKDMAKSLVAALNAEMLESSAANLLDGKLDDASRTAAKKWVRGYLIPYGCRGPSELAKPTGIA